jgi:hypothetical protein
MRHLLTVAGAAHLGPFEELRVSRLTAPENTGASTKTTPLYGVQAPVLSNIQHGDPAVRDTKAAKMAYEQALQTVSGFAIVRVLLLQRTKDSRKCVHCRKRMS